MEARTQTGVNKKSSEFQEFKSSSHLLPGILRSHTLFIFPSNFFFLWRTDKSRWFGPLRWAKEQFITIGRTHDCFLTPTVSILRQQPLHCPQQAEYVCMPHNYREQERSFPPTLTTLTTHFLCFPTCYYSENTYINLFSLISAGKWVKRQRGKHWEAVQKQRCSLPVWHEEPVVEETSDTVARWKIPHKLVKHLHRHNWRFPQKENNYRGKSCKWNRVFNWRTEQVQRW